MTILRHPVRIVAVVLLLAGMAMAVFGVARSVDGWNWSDENRIIADGQPHEVETLNRTVWLWNDEGDGYDGSACTATDAWGDALEKSGIREHITRPGSKMGDYEALWEFHTYGPTALITCEPAQGRSPEAVLYAEPSPRVIALAGNDPWIVRGVLLGFLAVLLFLGALVVERANRRIAVSQAEAPDENAPGMEADRD